MLMLIRRCYDIDAAAADAYFSITDDIFTISPGRWLLITLR